MNRKGFDLQPIIVPLQDWFMREGRQLPWRVKLPGQEGEGLKEPDPYRIWVSEIMLQQTRIETVKPYYRRFLQQLPDVAALAAAPLEELHKLWEGLGYYSRVRNMKTAAEQVMTDYGGKMPDSFEELLKLKGIGRYTAGAVASIAYGEPVPAVDGNVLRVLARVSADDGDIGKQSQKNRYEKMLAELMQNNLSVLQPGIFNQALMELGEIICIPGGVPHCGDCPWKDLCQSKKEGLTDRIPVKTRSGDRRIEERTVVLLRLGDRVALRKRPDQGLLAGLYEFPNWEGTMSAETVMEELKTYGLKPERIRPVPDAKHIFSHVEWKMKGYEVEIAENQTDENADFIFLERTQLRKEYAVPAAFSAYMKLL